VKKEKRKETKEKRKIYTVQCYSTVKEREIYRL